MRQEKQVSRLTVAAVVFVIFFTEGLAAATILHDPVTQTTLAGGSVTYVCTGQGEVNWYIDDQLVSFYTGSLQDLEDDGFTFVSDYLSGGVTTLTMTVPAKNSRNMTKIQCKAFGSGGSQDDSNVAWLWIVAPPLPPNVSVVLTSWNTMQLSWTAPFTAEGFPIIKYIVNTTNTTTGQRTPTDIYPSSGAETHTILDSPSDCHTLQFEVFAESSAGLSTAGEVSRGFPVAVSEFDVDVSVVLLLEDLTPQSIISFHLPDICSDSGVSATYILELKNSAGGMVQRTIAEYQHSIVIEETWTIDNCDSYTVNVTVFTPSHTELGSYTKITAFSISFSCPPEDPSLTVSFDTVSSTPSNPISASTRTSMQTLPHTPSTDVPATTEATPLITGPDTNDDSAENVSTVVLSIITAVLFLIVLTVAGTVVCLLFLRRKRKTVDQQRVQSSLSSMATNPIYNTGSPVYDVIPDINNAKPKHIHSQHSSPTDIRYLSVPSKRPTLAREDSGIYDTLAKKHCEEDGDDGQRGHTEEQKEECYVLMQSHIV